VRAGPRRLLLLLPLVALLVGASALRAANDGKPAFFEPKVLSSKNGVLRITLVGEQRTAMVNGQPVTGMRVFNGSYPAPTLKLQPGDRVEITLVNKLDEVTNLHFHGFRVTPSLIGDNVLRTIAPAVTTNGVAKGTVAQVRFRIPTDHQQGLYWYHPHHHMYTDDQVYGGMAGMIEIGDPLADLPALHGIKQRMLGLTAVEVDGGALNYDSSVSKEMNLVNGRLTPTLTMHPGETQLWRVANISNENWYTLQMPGHVFHVIGEDGNPVPTLRNEHTLRLPPGKRFEFLIEAGNPGTYPLRSLAFNQGHDKFGQLTLATLVVAGQHETTRTLPTVVSPHEALEQERTLTEPIVAHRTLTFSIDKPFPTQTFNGFRINGKLFGKNPAYEKVRLNTTEEWLIRNTSFEDHPFHIHTNDFLVTKINGKRVAPDGFQDVARIPRNGSITIRMRFRTFTGKAVFHCHILFHEDHGMMGIVQFVRH
jgi:FtsP/CotA-like multicopper oxidase with cupredoxin domain